MFCWCRRLAVSASVVPGSLRTNDRGIGYQWDFRPRPSQPFGITMGGGAWPDALSIVDVQSPDHGKAFRDFADREQIVREFVLLAKASEVLES